MNIQKVILQNLPIHWFDALHILLDKQTSQNKLNKLNWIRSQFKTIGVLNYSAL